MAISCGNACIIASLFTFGGAVRIAQKKYDACGVRGASTKGGPNISIVNGEPASPCDWRWQVKLTSYWNPTPYCGGMLLSENWVLSAAHCVDGPYFAVVAGSYDLQGGNSGEQTKYASKTYRHPSYDTPKQMQFDLALIKISGSFRMDGCTGTVCLPTKGADVAPGTQCWITGWGTLMSDGDRPPVLQQAPVNIIANEACGSYPAGDITDDMLCAQGKTAGGAIIDGCQGDSGGPLVCETNGKWTIYGATSFGFGCAEKEYPGIWARVHAGLDWIDTTMNPYSGVPW